MKACKEYRTNGQEEGANRKITRGAKGGNCQGWQTGKIARGGKRGKLPGGSKGSKQLHRGGIAPLPHSYSLPA